MIATLLLLAGLALLIVGGDLLVRGASSLARGLGVPAAVIGLTVVAFGTSLPELVVNVRASLEGASAISWGNVHGSNLANIGLILGLCGLLAPLKVAGGLATRELPLLVGASLLALALAADVALDAAAADTFGRGDGLALVVVFAAFLIMLARDVRAARRLQEPLLDQVPTPTRHGLPRDVAFCLAGLLGLVFGGQLAVDGARDLAVAWGLPDAVIGLTVVAVGTSLPELTTSVMAARRGEADLAVANVVGSNLFNLLFVLGASAALAPASVPPGGLGDLTGGIVLATWLLLAAWRGRGVLGRGHAVCMLLAWVGWSAWRALSS